MLIMQEVLSEGRVILSSGLSAKAGRATSKHGEKKIMKKGATEEELIQFVHPH